MRKSTYIFLCVLFFTIQAFPQTATAPSAGTGTSGDPYQIATLENLYWIAASNTEVPSPNQATRWGSSTYYIQTADIDASPTSSWNSGAGWTPIGNLSFFQGKYNGGNHMISGLYLNQSTTNNVGLFSYTYGAELKNIGLEKANITGQTGVGGLVGLSQSSTIDNCYSNASVTGAGRIGVLVGYGYALTITNSHSTGTISGTGTYIGGLVGLFLGSPNTVNKCYSTASVNGGDQGAGGLVGRCDATTISNSYSTGTVSGTGNYYGGLVGTMNNFQSVINNSYSTGSVSGTGIYYGGLVGYLDGTVTNSYSTGSVISGGGLVGGGTVTVTNSFWDTETSGRLTSPGGTGKTTTEMKTQSTFTDAGWDFIVETTNGTNDYWEMNSGFNNGYPILSWQAVSVPTITTTPNIVSGSNIGFTAESGSISLNFVEMNKTPSNLPGGAVTINKYWEISDITGGNVKLRLYYLTSLASSFTGTPKIYHYNGSYWEELPTEAPVTSGSLTYVETTNYYSSFSPVTVGDNASALPVELNAFSATVNGSSVNLKWQTATEVNNSGFEVQRTIQNSKLKIQNWQNVGFVAGAGNSNSPKSYSFTDQPTGGNSFSYRIKQIDNDGKFKCYDAITVNLTASQKAELIGNYPNPFNPSTTIKFYIPNNSDVTIKIYDMLGKEVTTLVNKQTEAGYHIVYWNGMDRFGNSAASGVYIYRLTAGSFSQTKKMALLK